MDGIAGNVSPAAIIPAALARGHWPPLSFQQLLREAINELAQQGYVSPDQIEMWMLALRNAAESQLGLEVSIDSRTRRLFDEIFERLVDKGKALQYVPGATRFGLAIIRPQLRQELDRRIVAASDLIKLRRNEAVAGTLRRFQGWSTSIPAGGDETIDKREVRSSIGNDLAQYKFEQRRVEIDQGHKLLAGINDIVAKDNGAIAAVWHSHWREPNYNYRGDHKDRDQRVYALRGNWAMAEGLMTKGEGYTDEMTMPGQEVFCRCYYQYITSPRRLPDSMLTRKGQEWVERGRMAA